MLAELVQRPDGAVYRVRRDDIDFTLTVLDAADALTLHRKATLLAGAGHPRLAQVHEVGSFDGGQYLVTDFVPGLPLADLIADDPLPGWHALSLVLDLVEPLAAMHHSGLLHGDVNPHNVVVTDDGSARLIDAGRTGTALDLPTDPQADLRNLGELLFECLTGKLPSIAGNADPRSLVPEVGETLAAVVAALLAEDPDPGYQSGESLAVDLKRLLDEPDANFEPARAGDTGLGRTRFGQPALCGLDQARTLTMLTEVHPPNSRTPSLPPRSPGVPGPRTTWSGRTTVSAGCAAWPSTATGWTPASTATRSPRSAGTPRPRAEPPTSSAGTRTAASGPVSVVPTRSPPWSRSRR